MHHNIGCWLEISVSIPPQPKRKFVPRIKVWKLRDPRKQAELCEVFKAKTLDSELSQTSTVDERWTSLKDKLLQATKQVCGVSSNHPWRKQTWWWNNQVEEGVREKRRCFKCGRLLQAYIQSCSTPGQE